MRDSSSGVGGESAARAGDGRRVVRREAVVVVRNVRRVSCEMAWRHDEEAVAGPVLDVAVNASVTETFVREKAVTTTDKRKEFIMVQFWRLSFIIFHLYIFLLFLLIGDVASRPFYTPTYPLVLPSLFLALFFSL